jgi:hypothetical protein
VGRLASAADFEDGALYSDYQRFAFFAWRAEWLVNRFGPTGKWLVAGCGWGFLVDELLKLGVDAWGVDPSPYAKAKATENLSAASAARVLQVDLTTRAQLASARSAAGLTGNQRFDVTVTEDVLPVFSDAEITVGLTELRRVSNAIVHIVTAVPSGDLATRAVGLNWKTMVQWKTLVGNDTVLNAEGFIKLPDGTWRTEVL